MIPPSLWAGLSNSGLTLPILLYWREKCNKNNRPPAFLPGTDLLWSAISRLLLAGAYVRHMRAPDETLSEGRCGVFLIAGSSFYHSRLMLLFST